ncbi:unnamed protein product [Bursaphelenchus okinawaensis]|uniref:Uncharacterized protein n=1 Tax=Bursaphelenchus okinawaensis TaxID=465554 RepID=A0A811LM64_9BILA|nr:unnamed protein product [Bursaphelenchus okinawaensis]CAG9123985.1 unnamed protein product [Bursaphelenchus okinawaensis]
MSSSTKSELTEDEWKPIINPKKRRACTANGNGECLSIPGTSKPKPEGRFAHTVMSLEMLGDEHLAPYNEVESSSNLSYHNKPYKDEYDPVMPNVIEQEIVIADEFIDVESAAKSPPREDQEEQQVSPVRRVVSIHRNREMQQIYNLNKLNLDLKVENQRLRDANTRLKGALDERAIRLKNILAENARYCVKLKLLEKEFGVDAVKDVIGST